MSVTTPQLALSAWWSALTQRVQEEAGPGAPALLHLDALGDGPAPDASGLPLTHLPHRTLALGPRLAPGQAWCWTCHMTALMDAGLLRTHGPREPDGPLDPLTLATWSAATLGALRGPPDAVWLVDAHGRVRRGTLHTRCAACAAAPGPDAEPAVARRALADVRHVPALQPSHVGPVLQRLPRLRAADLLPTSLSLVSTRTEQPVYGIGRASTHEDAATLSALEALERHCGVRNRTGRPAVTATLEDLGRDALDPRAVGTYPAGRYAQRTFPCVPFHPRAVLSWVRGHHHGEDRPVAVPEDLVFYGYARARPSVVRESSSGCALGSSHGDALQYALLELLERDALLRWWYGDRPAARRALPDDPAQSVPLAALERRGVRVSSFDLSGGEGAAVALLVTDGPLGTLCGFGAEFTWAGAVGKALGELLSLTGVALHVRPDEARRAAELARHPHQIQTVDDHVLYSLTPHAQARVWSRLERSSVDGAAPRWTAQNLPELMRGLRGAGRDVISVDLTPRWLAAQGLHCVRAVVPGLIPMHFGADLQRDVICREFRGSVDPLPHPFG